VTDPTSPTVSVIAGGVGAARMLAGLVQVVDPAEVTAVVNVADDLELHGLRISPDLDTIIYTLAGEIDPDRGWGLRNESWQAMATVARYGGVAWFNLGDRDLGTHLYRTQRYAEGAPLSTITAEIAAAWGLGVGLLPVTNDRLRTMVTLDGDDGDPGDAGDEVTFQEYFVKHRHAVPVRSVRFDGAEAATPAPGVIEAIATADRVVIAPSNPVVSIDPVLAVPGVADALMARRTDVVAVSPIVAGAALKGPADRLLRELGHEATVVAIARWYAPLAATLVIDEADAELADAVAAEGVRPVVAPTVMVDPAAGAALARTVLAGTALSR
jgi:LPPG:FO 2-phospho-L-lactate transferase